MALPFTHLVAAFSLSADEEVAGEAAAVEGRRQQREAVGAEGVKRGQPSREEEASGLTLLSVGLLRFRRLKGQRRREESQLVKPLRARMKAKGLNPFRPRAGRHSFCSSPKFIQSDRREEKPYFDGQKGHGKMVGSRSRKGVAKFP